jgi:cystinosin
VYLNYKRKSTVGWAVGMVLLDITGGTLSIAQQILDTHRKNIDMDIVKLMLGLQSILYDGIFM